MGDGQVRKKKRKEEEPNGTKSLERKARWNDAFGLDGGRKRFAVCYGVLIAEQSKGVERPHHYGLAA